MERSLRAGSARFAAGMVSMGVLMLARPDVPAVFVPLPPSLPCPLFLTGLSGAWLSTSAVTMLIDRQARSGALAMAGLLSLGMLLHLRPVLMHPGTPAWAVAFETVVLAGGHDAFTHVRIVGDHRACAAGSRQPVECRRVEQPDHRARVLRGLVDHAREPGAEPSPRSPNDSGHAAAGQPGLELTLRPTCCDQADFLWAAVQQNASFDRQRAHMFRACDKALESAGFVQTHRQMPRRYLASGV